MPMTPAFDVYGTPIDTHGVVASLGRRLGAAGLRLATAESCTGGMIGALLTAVPGSSEYYAGGVVAYSNRVKEEFLGVPEELLRRYGAVSAECVRAMAEGVRARFGVDLAVAVSGIAGPGGGTAEKPVGLVYLAVAAEEGTETRKEVFPGDRAGVRRSAAAAALGMLAEVVERKTGTVDDRG